VTTTSRAPDEPRPRRQAGGRLVPDPRPGDRDMREIKDPYDLPFPDLPDRRAPGRPMYVIVVDQLRDRQPGQPPSLAELLETRAACTHEPEPDLEAEP
jgi:hypothetical protein